MQNRLQYLVRLLGTRAGWPENMTSEEERIMGEHFEYLRDLTEKGIVLMAGPVFDFKFGLIVLEVKSESELEKIMQAEPSVVQGVHTYDKSIMRVSLMAKRA